MCVCIVSESQKRVDYLGPGIKIGLVMPLAVLHYALLHMPVLTVMATGKHHNNNYVLASTILYIINYINTIACT